MTVIIKKKREKAKRTAEIKKQFRILSSETLWSEAKSTV